ncbi:NlpC/P60 family protein [Polycladidibacter hongkongensis]|uniref:C40 family peptidase n=1 Tax=Polycladidibacter hongkongensis TaxID=1647556 RepID=UPI00082E2038|nr:NlpC/P60 family protein [Pseudovibrio hongkongensis]
MQADRRTTLASANVLVDQFGSACLPIAPAQLRQIAEELVDLKPTPEHQTGIDTQLLFGEKVEVYAELDSGWSYIRAIKDGYVGWLRSEALDVLHTATHKLSALRSFCYDGPDLKNKLLRTLHTGSPLTITGYQETRGTRYARLIDGSFVIADHIVELDYFEVDWVAVAERFVNTPYRWGGRSSSGVDCSGLVQLAAASGGHALLRDADMQEQTAGRLLATEINNTAISRGDLVFWRGHVAIIIDANTLLHANGHTMTVAYEPLDAAIKRIGAHEFGEVTSIRRLAP